MAVSPILLNTLPFDATKDHYLQFSYSGSQIQGYRITIKNNVTNEAVCDPIVNNSSLKSEALIPANTLTNGNTYNFQIEVLCWNDAGTEKVYSDPSNIVVLKCFATPEFGFTNITQGMIVRNSYIDAELFYTCEDSTEVLNQYRIILYGDDTTTAVYDSGTLYTTVGLTVRISGLTDDATYYIQATCETLNGMELATDKIQILCNYIKPDLFLAFYAENIPTEGLVRLSSNFVSIEGDSDPKELIYIDDEKVSLINGEKVWFDKGFTLGNGVYKIIAENLIDFSQIITLNLKTAKAYVMWCKGLFDGEEILKYYAELTAYQYVGYEQLKYVQISNRINPPIDGEKIFFWIRHVNGMFDIQIEKLTAEQATEIIDEQAIEAENTNDAQNVDNIESGDSE